jgi:hypothetical protein
LTTRRPIYSISCVILWALTLLGCGEGLVSSDNCGDPLTLTNIPALPVLGGYPSQTDKSSITLFGTKSPNTSIAINDRSATEFDCLTTWAADVTLSDEDNPLKIFGLNPIGAAGPSLTINIEKQAVLPPPPPSKKVLGRPLCDVNGDGFDDLLVGSYENDAEGKSNVGRVFIYYGGSSGPDTGADVTLTGEAAQDRFGISVACAGDVNKDGFSDILVGAFLNDAAGQDAGRAYLFYGGSALTNKNASAADLKLNAQAERDQFGLSVSTAGDVNGDGYDDVMVGAYQNDGGGANAGRAYIYYGADDMDTLPDVVLTGEETGDQLGIRVAWAGDVDGDTYDDVIIGADRADVGSLFDAGKAYLFLGGPHMAGQNAEQADVILEGATEDEAFASVGGAGDLDDDGFSDVVVGASAFTAGSGTEICDNFEDDDGDLFTDRRDPDCHLGQVYVFRGGSSIPPRISANDADYIIERPLGADGFGFSLTSAGDVNQDGYGDLLIGAFLSDRSLGGGVIAEDAGSAYLYLGGNPFRSAQKVSTADATFLGEASLPVPDTPLSGQFGFALSGAGDVNGDGTSDIIIGAYLHDTGILLTQADVGKVYLFLGPLSSSLNPIAATTADLAIVGSENPPLGPDNGFGVSVQ